MRTQTALFLAFLALYAYFFQGGGWNQNSRFDLTRAVVEERSFDIRRYASNTGDLAIVSGGVYSNKPPGQSLLGVPIYALSWGVERWLDLDPRSPPLLTANAHLVTIATSALPGALLVSLLFAAFLRNGCPRRSAFELSVAFGLGSLILPYAGVLMAHNLVACSLFAAWFALGREPSRPGAMSMGGAALGVGLLTEYLLAPTLLLFALLHYRRRRALGRTGWFFWIGPIVALGAVLLYNHAIFGHFLRTSYSSENAAFRDQALFLGVFGAPELRRIYWLTLHPFRGLLFNCPVFFLPSLWPIVRLAERRSLATAPSAGVPSRDDGVFCLALVLYFFLFNLCFNGWTGGWGVGPRYLIPILPFLFLFSVPAYLRFPRLSYGLMATSAISMLILTSVLVMSPGPNQGAPPAGRNPLFEAAEAFAQGRMSIASQGVLERASPEGPTGEIVGRWSSYNLGELLGLRGPASLLPLLLIALWLFRQHGASSLNPPPSSPSSDENATLAQ